ncbi:hypothetical protein ACG04R_17370 [Roseateles sp. BYS78W]|uniref:Uncharacterized protein n=1 Tax=Pelomonas candidula TaxID=3299025 RepID=A0ABW7HEW5_9BURK
MDYRALLAVPLAALALSASGAEKLRQPEGWMSQASYAWPQGLTHEAGVAPETEGSGQRALTVRALGKRQPHEIGSISQYVFGYAGRRIRLTAQVKTAGVDGWAGLVVSQGYTPLPYLPFATTPAPTPPLGTAGCPDWCEVSVVADIPAGADNEAPGVANVGLALIGNGQAWARSLRVEAVGRDVPLTTEVFAAKATEAARAMVQQGQQMRAAQKTTPKNLALR